MRPLVAILAMATLAACSGRADHLQPDAPNDGGGNAQTEVAAGDSVVVQGSLVGSRCFAASRANTGADHAQPVPASQSGTGCARFCLRQGFPAALLVDEGTASESVWMLLAIPPVLGDYAGQRVRVTGVVRSQGVLIPDRVERRRSDGTWAFVM